MPKIYDQKHDPERGAGGGGPAPAQKRTMMLAIVAILAVIIIFMLYRMARGEEFQGTITQPTTSNISYQWTR